VITDKLDGSPFPEVCIGDVPYYGSLEGTLGIQYEWRSGVAVVL